MEGSNKTIFQAILCHFMILPSCIFGFNPLENIAIAPAAGAHANVMNIFQRFTAFQPHMVVNHIRDESTALSNFKISLFQPLAPLTFLNQQNSNHLLQTLQQSLRSLINFTRQNPPIAVGGITAQNIQDFNGYTQSILNNTIKIVGHRYRLAKIEANIVTGNGQMGNQVFNTLAAPPFSVNQNVVNTLRDCIGRIFVIKVEGGVSRIISTSTGIIYPYSVQGITHYDRILTCGHSVKPEETGSNLEFYFVRSEGLQSNTGLPNPMVIGPAMGIAGNVFNSNNLIDYLRQQSIDPNNNAVRRIISFQALNHDSSNLSHHAPLYGQDTDGGLGTLNATFRFPGVNHCRIIIRRDAGSFPYNGRHYAFGYPIFAYFDVAGQSLLVQQRRFAPLTMTKTDVANVNLANNRITHGAPTAPGMSGGPIVRFTAAQIEIIGIIQSGSMDVNYGTWLR